MKRTLKFFFFILISYVFICVVLFFAQKQLLFQCTKLEEGHVYNFKYPFEELYFKTADDNVKLNAVHFTVEDSIQKGSVLFLHGNGGTLQGWGYEAHFFIENNYEVLFLEYREYGKSGGEIESENQLIDDAQLAYDYIKKEFNEDQIIISGTSMGTGVASQLAIRNNPRMLILNAPFFGLNELIQEKLFFIPEFVIRYKFKTYEVLPKLKCPVEIFHGTKDRLIPIDHSERLKELNDNSHLTYCNGGGHNSFSKTIDYANRIGLILN